MRNTTTTIALLSSLCTLALATPLARAQDAQPTDAASTGTATDTATATATDTATATATATDTATATEPDTATATEPEPATANELEPAPDDFRGKILELGLRAGIYVPSLFNAMGPHADLSFEVGVILPFIDGRLAIVADVGWSPPGASGSGTDPRIGMSGGPWTYEMTTSELMVSLGPVFRFLPPGSPFVPYVGVLGRAYFVRTTVDGTGGGNAFGENTEQSTQWGVVGALGGELRLGPGAALLEVSLGGSSLPHRITGDTTTAALAAQLGYRLFL